MTKLTLFIYRVYIHFPHLFMLVTRSRRWRYKRAALLLLVDSLLCYLGLSRANRRYHLCLDGIHFVVDAARFDIGGVCSVQFGGMYSEFDRELPDDAILIDGGANVGAFTMTYARAFPRARIFSFEPSPTTFAKLAEAARLNGYANVTLFDRAIRDHEGELLFLDEQFSNYSRVVEPGESVDPGRVVQVQSLVLDRFVQEQRLPRIDLLKLDIEGCELPALRSGIDHLLPLTRFLAIEVHHDEGFAQIEELLSSHGFRFVKRQFTNVFYRRVATPERARAVWGEAGEGASEDVTKIG